MRKLALTVSVLLIAMSISPSLWAKKRRKKKNINKSEWLKKKEDMTAKQLQRLIEENHQLKTQQEELEERSNTTQEELDRLRELREKINSLKAAKGLDTSDDNLDLEALFQQEQAKQQAEKNMAPGEFTKEDWAIDENGKSYIKGISFKVQIGAYKKRDLTQVLENTEGLEAFEQENINGLSIFTIRHFRNYWKANKFKKEIRAMGVKDAYIVCFVDGKRVSLKSVLEKVRSQKN